MNKWNFQFTPEAWNYNDTRLTNQIFKILPMMEKDEDWEKQCETVILELKGYNKIFADSPGFMVMVSKLAALEYAEDKMAFRKLIFEAITELKSIII